MLGENIIKTAAFLISGFLSSTGICVTSRYSFNHISSSNTILQILLPVMIPVPVCVLVTVICYLTGRKLMSDTCPDEIKILRASLLGEATGLLILILMPGNVLT